MESCKNQFLKCRAAVNIFSTAEFLYQKVMVLAGREGDRDTYSYHTVRTHSGTLYRITSWKHQILNPLNAAPPTSSTWDSGNIEKLSHIKSHNLKLLCLHSRKILCSCRTSLLDKWSALYL